jgi:hypothetical protein
MHILAPVLTRLFSALLALALIAGGVVLIVEVVAAWAGGGWTILPDDTTARFQMWRWNDRSVVETIIVVGAVGLLAVLIAVWPRPPLTVPIAGRTDVSYERHALEQTVRRQLQGLDGVSKARVRADHRRLVARLDTNRQHQPEELRSRAEAVLETIVADRHLELQPTVRLRAPRAAS